MSGDPDQVRTIPARSWRAEVTAAYAGGWVGFDWLGCVDEIGRTDDFTVVLRLVRPDRRTEGLRLSTTVPRSSPVLDSVAAVFPGAGWHEREGSDLFGVTFTDGDPRPLLLDGSGGPPPLRKDAVLGARAAADWPGAKDPSDRSGREAPTAGGSSPSRRRTLPAGVPEPEVWGDRLAPGPADPGEVARSLSGARVRRRHR